MSTLAGLRIVDFSRFLPGGYVSWIAGDLGADVIRIEHPRELAKRAAMLGPDDTATRARPSYSRNKGSLRINPGHPAARAAVLALIARADVLIEDFRPGVMAAMGLGPGEMLRHNPRLVYCSVLFAGQIGPRAASVGHDPAALELAGALSRLNGLPTPSLPGLQVADVLAGAGQRVDVAMTDASLPEPADAPRRAPVLGEDSEAVLTELGYDAAAVAVLRAEKVI